jgi:hypothetical protein
MSIDSPSARGSTTWPNPTDASACSPSLCCRFREAGGHQVLPCEMGHTAYHRARRFSIGNNERAGMDFHPGSLINYFRRKHHSLSAGVSPSKVSLPAEAIEKSIS